jgi:MoaA/NifB/PqqE/SkfB family radical SAM enzyme
VISAPRLITFHVTDACPYQCVHCWMTGITRNKGLPGVYYLQAARSIRDLYGEATVLLDGGEALTRPDLPALIGGMVGMGLRVLLNTNGFLVTRDLARTLADRGLRYINLSLDGTREVHDRIRAHPEAFDRALTAIDHFASTDPPMDITILTTLQAGNLQDAPTYLPWILSDRRIAGVQLQVISNPRGPDADAAFLADATLWPPDIDEAVAAVDRIYALQAGGLRIKNPPRQLRLFQEYFRDPIGFTRGVTCLADEVGLVIDALGNVKICGLMEPAGSLIRDDFSDILRSVEMADLRRKMHACRRTGCHYVMNCFFTEAGLLPDPAKR